MFKGLSRHLYLRIWLAVVAGVAVLMLVVGWFWRASMEHNTPPPMPRDWIIMTPKGEVLGTSAPRHRPGLPLDFEFTMPDGREMQLQIQRKWEDGRPPPRLHREPPWWATPPYGFFWMLGLIGLAIALAGLSGQALANGGYYGGHHGNRHGYHHRNNYYSGSNWVAPLVALGVAGAVISATSRPAPTYVEPSVTYYPPQPAPSVSYFCGSSGQFYPYTSYCPEGWQLVQSGYR